MGLERYSFFLDLTKVVEAEYLVAPAVRENRFAPPDELVKPPRRFDELCSRPKVKMIRVAKNDLRTNLVKFPLLDRLDTSLGADRHEDGRFDRAVIGLNEP